MRVIATFTGTANPGWHLATGRAYLIEVTGHPGDWLMVDFFDHPLTRVFRIPYQDWDMFFENWHIDKWL